MKQHSKHVRRTWRMPPRVRRLLLIAGAGAIALFIVVNAALWILYRERTYPGTRVMDTAIGSVSYGSLSEKISNLQLLPDKLTLMHTDKRATASLDELGITKNVERTAASANKHRAWLPIANLFSRPELDAPVAIDRNTFAAKGKELAAVFAQEPVNARLTLSGATVDIAAAKDGYVLDTARLQDKLIDELDHGKQTVVVPVTVTKPAIPVSEMQDDKTGLQQRIDTTISFTYNGKRKQASREEVASWHVQSGETYTLSTDAVQAYIVQAGSGFGIRVKDIDQAAESVKQALADKKTATITLTAQVAVKTYVYCTAVKGVDAGQLSGLRAKLKSAFADPRGWSLNGLVEYNEGTAGCTFTVWLAAAELMPTFGAICDSMWSCRVGPNVVINYDRWQNASPAWNASGGTLDEYRNMVINHETGHWLGFGHRNCPGAGQPAPVMQQQSIDLQGCSFNAWPVAAELATLRQSLGI